MVPLHRDYRPHKDWQRTGLPHKGCIPHHTDLHHRGCNQLRMDLQHTGSPHMDYIQRHTGSPRMDWHHMDLPRTGSHHRDYCLLLAVSPGPDWRPPGYLPCGYSDQARRRRLLQGRPHQTEVCFSRSFPETIHSKDRAQRDANPAARKGQHKPQPAMHTA